MKVLSQKIEFDHGCRTGFRILIDGVESICFVDGEPEDSSINRNYNDVLKITDLMELAHAAGLRGEKLECTHENVEEDVFFD